MLESAGVEGKDVKEFLLGIPGKNFITKDMKGYFHDEIGVDPMKYLTYSSIEDFGNCGGATMLIQLDCLARANVLGNGDIVAAYLEEQMDVWRIYSFSTIINSILAMQKAALRKGFF